MTQHHGRLLLILSSDLPVGLLAGPQCRLGSRRAASAAKDSKNLFQFDPNLPHDLLRLRQILAGLIAAANSRQSIEMPERANIESGLRFAEIVGMDVSHRALEIGVCHLGAL